MAQFRVEFVLDPATGKYLAEMYHPERDNELLLRTEALYPSQEAAVLGVVQLFRNAVLNLPKKTKKAKKRPAKAKKAKRRPTSKRRK